MSKTEGQKIGEQMGKKIGKQLGKAVVQGLKEEFNKGYKQAEKELIPLINQLCEAILFEWKDAADLARKTLTQIKAQEEK